MPCNELVQLYIWLFLGITTLAESSRFGLMRLYGSCDPFGGPDLAVMPRQHPSETPNTITLASTCVLHRTFSFCMHERTKTEGISFDCSYVTQLDQLPGALPSAAISKDADVVTAAKTVVSKLANLSKDMFTRDALWRDQFALCGTLRTFYEPQRILPAWKIVSSYNPTANFQYIEGSARNAGNWVECRFTFRTHGVPALSNSGILYLVEQQGEWKIWLLCTIAEDIVGHESLDLRNGTPGTIANGAGGLVDAHRSNGNAVHNFDCVIVGGGQAGLSTGAWCKSLHLDYVIVERNANVGDNWLKRYKSAKLHTSRRFNDLPFGPTFTNDDPEWLSTKALSAGYQKFVKRFDINIWLSANIQGICHWTDAQKLWTIHVEHDGAVKTLKTPFLVLATGPGGQVPLKPRLPGEESFKGVVMHSIEYQSAEDWSGKKAVVVGTANTAHDVAEDMYKAGCSSVTMLQRNATYVVPRQFFKTLFDMIWNDDIPQEVSDRFFWSPPIGISRLMTNAFFWPAHDREPELENNLEKVGFKVLRHADFLDHLLIRFGGHYMNCGVSEMIVDGRIKIKSDSALIGFNPTGLDFADGSKVDADVVVFATGFDKDTKYSASQIVGDEMAGRLERYWGVEEEGEIGLAFKPNSLEHFFVCGGGCAHAYVKSLDSLLHRILSLRDRRYFTRFIALQIRAATLGTPFKMFNGTPVDAA